LPPEPETAWYVATRRETRPASSWSGFRTGIAAMVVQFGLAMIPLGSSSMSPALTSETTSGTSGSLRQALELSMTVAPAAATLGAYSLLEEPPLENSAMSRPEKSAVAVSSTVTSWSFHGRVDPADRADAK